MLWEYIRYLMFNIEVSIVLQQYKHEMLGLHPLSFVIYKLSANYFNCT